MTLVTTVTRTVAVSVGILAFPLVLSGVLVRNWVRRLLTR